MIDRDEFLKLHKQGLSTVQLAERFGCSTRHVTRLRGLLGVAQPAAANIGCRVSPERLAAASALLADGASAGEVQRTLGMNWATVAKYFPGSGWSKVQSAEFSRMFQQARKSGLVL